MIASATLPNASSGRTSSPCASSGESAGTQCRAASDGPHLDASEEARLIPASAVEALPSTAAALAKEASAATAASRGRGSGAFSGEKEEEEE